MEKFYVEEIRDSAKGNEVTYESETLFNEKLPRRRRTLSTIHQMKKAQHQILNVVDVIG
jgi:hypothetical protein